MRLQSCVRDEPSGRSLDPGCEAGARGMIVDARRKLCGTESGLQACPPFFQNVHVF